MINGLRRRLANFGLLVGGVMLALFFTSDAASAPNAKFLLWGLLLVIFGWMLGKKKKNHPEESNRFRTIRRIKRGEGLFPKPEIEDESINSEF